MRASPLSLLSFWRRLWLALPLAYKLVLLALGAVMTATLAVLIVTYASAGASLKLQLERQLSRDLNVCERWYKARQEELQLTAVGLVRHPELARALSRGEPALSAALLEGEVSRLHLDLALLVDQDGRLLAAGRAPFDPGGLVHEAIARREQLVATEAWTAAQLLALPHPQPGLVRVVVTPVYGARGPLGALVLGDWVGERSEVPKQLTAMLGGAVALSSLEGVVAASGFPGQLALAPELLGDVRAGRYFYTEQALSGQAYLLAFRPLVDHEGRTVGAFVRGFPESEITETLQRYAGSISLFTAAAVLFSLVALLWLTRRVLLPLGRLARASARLAEGGAVELPAGPAGRDELAALATGVGAIAERLLQHDRQRKQLLEKIISAQEDERKRIARELHDQTGQALTGLLVGLKVLEGAHSLAEARARTVDLKALALATLEDVHRLSVALRPAMLDDLGLSAALRSLVKGFAAQHGLAARCEVDALEPRLPGLWEVTLYRVAQEALTNAGKYARAREVEVSLRLEGERVTLVVVDDGCGFDPTQVGTDGREHLGLLGMQERAALIGASFRLESTPRGTRIEVTLVRPAHAEKEAAPHDLRHASYPDPDRG